jgi:hypothetical protein
MDDDDGGVDAGDDDDDDAGADDDIKCGDGDGVVDDGTIPTLDQDGMEEIE